MQTSTSPGALPSFFVRRRNAIVVSAGFGILFIMVGVFINLNFTEVTHDDLLYLVGMTAICLAPFLGVQATRMAWQDLLGIERGIIPSSLFPIVLWGRRLGVIATAGNTILLFIFIIQVLSVTADNQMKDVMVEDLNNLIHAASSYRNRSAATHGGAGSYAGFTLSPSYTSIQDRSYIVTVLDPDTLLLGAIWREDSNSRIDVKIGPDGNSVEPWVFRGKFSAENSLDAEQ
jgi:hypothetical protein